MKPYKQAFEKGGERWYNRVPTSDEEVEMYVKDTYPDDILQDCFIGIYHCHRAMGKNVTDSYRNMLESFLKTDLDKQ